MPVSTYIADPYESVETMPVADTVPAHADSMAGYRPHYLPNGTPLPAKETVTVQEVAADRNFLTGDTVYNVAVIICFVWLCIILYRFRRYISRTAAGVVKNAAKIPDTHNAIFTAYINNGKFLFFWTLSLSIIRICDLFFGRQIFSVLSGWTITALPVLVFAVIVLINLCQIAAITAAGRITESIYTAKELIGLKNILYAFSSVIITPLFLLFASGSGSIVLIMANIFMYIIGILLLIFLIQTYIFFFEHKIPILFWLLYLCAVEIFPISLFLLLALKII